MSLSSLSSGSLGSPTSSSSLISHTAEMNPWENALTTMLEAVLSVSELKESKEEKEHKEGLASDDERLEDNLARDEILLYQCGWMLGKLQQYGKALSGSQFPRDEKCEEVSQNYVVPRARFDFIGASYLTERAYKLYSLGRYKEVVSLCDQSLHIDSENAETLRVYGDALLALGQDKEALTICHLLLWMRPNDVHAYINLGDALRHLGQNEEALKSYERALDAALHQTSEYKKKQASLGQTQEFRQQSLKFQSKLARIYFKRGRILYELGQKRQALISLETACKLRSKYEVEILPDLAYLLNELGQRQEALRFYDEFLRSQPKHAQAWGRRGSLLHALKRYEEALESYNQSLSLGLDESIFRKRDEVIEVLSQKVPALIKEIQSNSMTSLNLSHFTVLDILPTPHMSRLTPEDLEPVLIALKENTSVTRLDLSNNVKLTDEVIPLIAGLLSVGFFSSLFLRQKPNITLKEIDLQNTLVTYEGMKGLVEEIKSTQLTVQILYDWQYAISTKDIQCLSRLGRGRYAEVNEGVYKPLKMPVALKMFPAGEEGQIRDDFQKEVHIMSQLRTHASKEKNEPYVVSFYGYCPYPVHWKFHYHVLAMELMQCSLHDILQSGRQLLMSSYYQIAIDVLRGLSTIHRRNIIHLDLNSTNVLLNLVHNQWRAKISDFGLSQRVHKSKQNTPISISLARFKGNIRWRAPELMGSHPSYSEKSDIYSFGMVLWEMAARKNPYKEMKEEKIAERVRRGERETIPADVEKSDPGFVSLIKRCWAQKPQARPTAEEAIKYLVGIAKDKKLELS